MIIHSQWILSLALLILPCGKSLAAPPETVHLWPAKLAATEGGPTEEISPKRRGNTIRIAKIHSPSITVYQPEGSDTPRPAVLVCPGGGYYILAIDKSGTEIAEWLNSIGITAIVLKYTVPNQKDEAFKDIQRAMGIIRQNAEKWNIDPDKLGVLGSSAGGHLAARLGNSDGKRTYEANDEADTLNCLPDYCMLIYPAWLEADQIVKTTPPTFIVQTRDDNYVKPTIPYAEALKEKQIPSEFHLFDTGGHGYGLRPSKHPVSEWPKLCEAWMKKTILEKE